MTQYAGCDKWEVEIKYQDDLHHPHQWKGQSNFPLEGFIAQHQNAFVSMQQCAEHVEYQLPNEHTHVGYLLEGIVCPDLGLQAAMASIHTDDGPTGMRNDFETTAAHILPYDPVTKKRAAAGSKRTAAQVSLVEVPETAEISSAMKVSIGKTGVHLWYHTPEEYCQLTDDQKSELQEWQSNKSGKKQAAKPSKQTKKLTKGFNKKQVSSAVARELRRALAKDISEEKAEESDDGIDAEAYIASMVEAAVNKLAKPAVSEKVKLKVTLHSILKTALMVSCYAPGPL